MDYFERLVASVERIARHAYFPEKEQAVGRCLEDVDDLLMAGRITEQQGEALRDILLSACSIAA